uniref:C2H2-type domain-containing protein n=1 Tax=Oncorhynchus tshawytscha TaxID=74940 RepID=A0AAZ3SWR5_ONCTS
MEVSGSDVVFQSETGNVNQGLQQYTGFEPRAERPSLDTKCDMYGGLNLLRDSLNQVCREVVGTDDGASAAHTKVMDLGSGPVGLETQTSSDIEMRSVGLENHRFSPKSFHSSSEHVIVIDSVSSGQQVDRDFEWGQVGTASTQVNGTGNTQGEGVFERNAPTMASLHRHFEIPGRGVQQPAHTSLPVGHFRQSATTSSHSSNLATHVRPDTIERLYGCLSCHKKFVHESDLRQHVVVHNRKRAFACNLCEKSFMSRTDLQMHLNVHTGEKPFSCAHCGRRFSHSSNLKRHQKLCTVEQPYSCPNCHKKFVHESGLRQHAVVHTRKRGFGCTLCEKSFVCARQLQMHLNVHTGEKPFREVKVESCVLPNQCV